jgi:hypothetical protein
VTPLNAGVPGAESIRTGPESCHSLLGAEGCQTQKFIGGVASDVPSRAAGDVLYEGRPGQARLVSTPANVVKESVLAAASSIFSASSAVDSGQTKTCRPQLSKSYPGSNFRKGSIRWCVSGVSASRPWGLLLTASTPSSRTPPRQV